MSFSGWAGKAKSKHGVAKKTACPCGIMHDSKKEQRRCQELALLEKAGEIRSLTRQPFYPFVINGEPLKMMSGHAGGVTLDFSYQTDNEMLAEDVKPKSKLADSRDWALRKAIFKHLYRGVRLIETR